MGVINEFGKALASIVKFGSKLNKDQREEVRKVVGELADELDRAIRLAQFYLEGAKNIKDRVDLSDYLRSGSQKLMGSYSEYKVCAGLYDLHDRFDQLFDPVKYSVSFGNIDKIHRLIDNLSHGERMVIDDLDNLLLSLRDLADELDASDLDEEEGIKKEIQVTLNIEHASLEEHRKLIKTTTRQVFESM